MSGTQKQIKYKKRVLSRKIKRHGVEVITRRSQSIPTSLMVDMPQLKVQSVGLLPVSSSWIAGLGYNAKRKVVTMSLLKGRAYDIHDVPLRCLNNGIMHTLRGLFGGILELKIIIRL